MVQMVTGLVFDGDGNVSATGADTESIDSTVAYHFGFYSRPKDGARGVVLKADGQGNTSFLIGFRDKQYEISLNKGEVGVQSAFGASTLWDQNGNIVETPGDGGKVQLGGPTTPDAAVLGTTFSSALNSFLTAANVFATALNVLNLALIPTTGVTPGAPATFTTACTAFETAIAALKAASYLSQTVELK